MPKYLVSWSAFGGHEVEAADEDAAVAATSEWLEIDKGIYCGPEVDGMDFRTETVR